MVDQETDSNHETFTDRVQQARAHYAQQAGLGKSLASPRIRSGSRALSRWAGLHRRFECAAQDFTPRCGPARSELDRRRICG